MANFETVRAALDGIACAAGWTLMLSALSAALISGAARIAGKRLRVTVEDRPRRLLPASAVVVQEPQTVAETDSGEDVAENG